MDGGRRARFATTGRTCCSRRRATAAGCRAARAAWICGITTRGSDANGVAPRGDRATPARGCTRAKTTTPASARWIRTTPTSSTSRPTPIRSRGTPLVSSADGKRHYELFRGERGANGKWTLTPFTRNSTFDNLRPVIPKWNDRRDRDRVDARRATCTTRASGIRRSWPRSSRRGADGWTRRDFVEDRGSRRHRLRADGYGAARRSDAAPPATARSRARWIGVMRRLADPVLNNLANGTLKARMPVEQAPGADRRSVTHLEALGRLLAGLAPWIELPPDDSHERRTAARAVCRSRPPRHRSRRRSLVAGLSELHARSAAAGRRRVPRAGPAARAARAARALDATAKRQLVAALESTRAIVPGFNNWLLFSATVEAGAEEPRRQLGSHARRLRAAAARAVVQGRRRLRRRPGVPLGLLQQLRHPPDAAGRARRVRR